MGRKPSESELSDKTGLARSTLRRCKLLIDLPEEYRDEMLMELKLPRPQQKLTEDFFIEMERALTTVSRSMPKTIPNRDRVRRVLIPKYREGVIKNRTDFRYPAKFRAELVRAKSTFRGGSPVEGGLIVYKELEALSRQIVDKTRAKGSVETTEAGREQSSHKAQYSLATRVIEILMDHLDHQRCPAQPVPLLAKSTQRRATPQRNRS